MITEPERASLAKQQALGFWRGFSAVFGALGTLLRLTRAWPYALVPVLVFLALETGCVLLSVRFVQPWVQARLASSTELGSWLGTVSSWLAVAVTAAFGWIVALVLTPPLSAPALERIVDVVERDIGAPARAPLGMLAEFWCGMRSALLSAAVILPLIVGLTLLELVAAPLAVVATPLKLLLAALGSAWGLFDYPLTLRGMALRQRVDLMKQHLGLVLGFASAVGLVFWLPCCSVIMLPVGVVAATQLYWQIQRQLPSRGVQ